MLLEFLLRLCWVVAQFVLNAEIVKHYGELHSASSLQCLLVAFLKL